MNCYYCLTDFVVVMAFHYNVFFKCINSEKKIFKFYQKKNYIRVITLSATAFPVTRFTWNIVEVCCLSVQQAQRALVATCVQSSCVYEICFSTLAQFARNEVSCWGEGGGEVGEIEIVVHLIITIILPSCTCLTCLSHHTHTHTWTRIRLPKVLTFSSPSPQT